MKTKGKIYIAGPMSGIINHNAYEFNQAAAMWRARGYEVFNPIDSPASRLVQEGKLGGQEAYRQCMALDCEWITGEATDIYMLNGWQRSPGATAEHYLAVCLSLNIHYEGGTPNNPYGAKMPKGSTYPDSTGTLS